MFKTTEPWLARQQRHLSFISEFSTDIKHLPGKDNVVADCLSRAAVDNVSVGIDYTALASAQMEDKDTQAYRTAITNLKIVSMPITPTGPTLLCDVSTGKPRPICPLFFSPPGVRSCAQPFTPQAEEPHKNSYLKSSSGTV